MFRAKNFVKLDTIRNTLKFALLIFALCSFTANKNERYHRVKAEYGDSIHSLLDRYHLADHDCNFSQFYKLNNLDHDSRLLNGQKYYIPVLIYNYNGKSIRTTLGLKSWEDALRIKKYNEQIRRENLRKYSIVKSGILWVPHHELGCSDNTAPAEKPKNEDLAMDSKPDEKDLNIKKEDKDTAAIERAEADKRIAKHEKLTQKVEVSAGYRRFPIFGPEHAYIPLVNNSLRGKVFYVVSGHGGPDSGAVGKHRGRQICEDEYAYDVSLRLARNLIERGALVYMVVRDPNDGLRSSKFLSCDTDEYCWGNYKIPRSQKARLYQRSDAINKLYEKHYAAGLKDQTVVTIHIDSRSKRQNTDVFFYYMPRSDEGKKLAKKLHQTFAAKYKKHRSSGKYHGTVTARDLHMLREPKPNSVFIELGNIQNSYDQQRFMLESNRQALANWMYQGLID